MEGSLICKILTCESFVTISSTVAELKACLRRALQSIGVSLVGADSQRSLNLFDL